MKMILVAALAGFSMNASADVTLKAGTSVTLEANEPVRVTCESADMNLSVCDIKIEKQSDGSTTFVLYKGDVKVMERTEANRFEVLVLAREFKDLGMCR